MPRHSVYSQFCSPDVKQGWYLNEAGVEILLMLSCLVYLWGNSVKERTNDGKVIKWLCINKCIWTSFSRKELVLYTEYGNKHDSRAVAGMNDGFVVMHSLASYPGAIDNEPVHVHVEKCPTLHWYHVFIWDLAVISTMANFAPGIKGSRRLFEGGIYSKKYSIYNKDGANICLGLYVSVFALMHHQSLLSALICPCI